jgi:hypothetical protein
MAFSNTISGTTFSALKVVDHAFRRCRLPAQGITAEMQTYALESLYLFLSELASIKTPSWCIEQLILPMYENQQIVELPTGTVEVLNLNYRTLQVVTGETVESSTQYLVNFTNQTAVNTVGIKWSAASVPLTFQVSTNGLVWITVDSVTATATAGEITWFDISGALPYQYFRITSTSTINYSAITLGNMPNEIPLGALNRDAYVNQNNKVFPSRPNSYWFQRDIPQPVINLWPAPYLAAEQAQLVVWRHRQIMDTENLQQEIEVPQRWLEAIVNNLAAKVAAETPAVDAQLIPVLDQKAAMSLQRAWDGDNDGSPIFINPGIGVYTK